MVKKLSLDRHLIHLLQYMHLQHVFTMGAEMDDLFGQHIGNYVVMEQIGVGGFGQVYLAQHTVLAKRLVAIKVLHRDLLPSAKKKEQFLQEAHVLEQLRHAHILAVLDVGMHEERPYLITPYAPGGTLTTRITRAAGRPFPLEEALRILSPIGQALFHAHQLHIVHRDLKPANILFAANGDALLTDFGIALVLETTKTRQLESATGTPAYMAPEQFENQVSARSDQYALAVIAYELLTGQRPFTAATPMALAFKHASEEPLPPRQLNPALPASVEQAIGRALAKNRADRFPDVQTFLAALHAPSFEHRDDTTVAGKTPFALPATETHASPTTSRQSLRAERLKRGKELSKEGRFEEALALFHQMLQLDPQDAKAYALIGMIQLAMGDYANASGVLVQATELNPNLWEAHRNLAFVLNELACYEDALQACEKALRLRPGDTQTYVLKAKALAGLQRLDAALLAYYQALHLDPSAAEIFADTGRLLFELQRYEEALECFEQARVLVPDNAYTHQCIATALHTLQRFEEAWQPIGTALRLDPDNASAWALQGAILVALEREVEALTAYEQAARLEPANLEYLIEKGNSLFRLHSVQDACATYREAVRLDPQNAAAWHNLALTLDQLDQRREAGKAHRQARKLGYRQ